MITKTQMKTAVETVANQLDSKLGRITTLELKNELRNQYPAVLWNQYTTNGVDGVSDLFHELVAEGRFTSVADNGTYQTYRSNKRLNSLTQSLGKALNVSSKATNNTANSAKVNATPTKAVSKSAKTPKLSRTKAHDMMKNNKGHFFTAVYTKKDGTTRTINCQYVKDQTPSLLGYVLVKEAKLLKAKAKEPIRNLNLQTLQTLKIGGTVYSVN